MDTTKIGITTEDFINGIKQSTQTGLTANGNILPLNPLYGAPKQVSEREIELLEQCESVRGS